MMSRTARTNRLIICYATQIYHAWMDGIICIFHSYLDVNLFLYSVSNCAYAKIWDVDEVCLFRKWQVDKLQKELKSSDSFINFEIKYF